MITVPELE